jgi:hypothetical protein
MPQNSFSVQRDEIWNIISARGERAGLVIPLEPIIPMFTRVEALA